MILSLLSNKYIQIALAAAVALAALWGYGARQHSLGYSQAQSERHTADLESFKAESRKLQGLSVTIETQLEQLRAASPQFIERYENVINKKPLPTNCFIDPDRLRELNAASAASGTGESGESMPRSGADQVK